MPRSLLELSFYKHFFFKRFGIINKYEGVYHDWDSALNNSKSYQSDETLNQIKNSALIGYQNDKFFRDGTVFEKYEFSSELNILLLNLSIQKNLDKKIVICDFGGGLGTLYFQFRKYCQLFNININYEWNILEQDDLAIYGNENIVSKNLNFFRSSKTDLEKIQADLVIFSSVLNFVQNPYIIINRLKKIKPKYIFIDRTAFWDGKYDVITILEANKKIKGSYPSHIFSLKEFKVQFSNLYYMKYYFNSKEGHFYFDRLKKGRYGGMIWEIK